MLKIFAISLCCFLLQPALAFCLPYKVIDGEAKTYFREKGIKGVDRFVVPLNTGSTRQIGRLMVAKGQPFEILPGQPFSFVGPPGSFLLFHNSEKQEVLIFPSKEEIIGEVDGRLFSNYTKLTKKARAYLGYYNPEEDTGRPNQPDPSDYIAIYSYPKNFFEGEDKGDRADTSKEEQKRITSIPKYGTIHPLKPASVGWWIFLLLAFPIYGFSFLALYRTIGKESYAIEFQIKKSRTSMRSLWSFDRKKDFLCIHCGQPLKIKDRFTCPAGHVPNKDRYIFDGCYKDNFQFKNIACNHCGRTISLDENIYNEEEIRNRGKQYLSIEPPLRKNGWWISAFALMISVGYLVIINLFPLYSIGNKITEATIMNYQSMYGNWSYYLKINPTPFVIAVVVLVGLITAIYTKIRKEVLIKNPYA